MFIKCKGFNRMIEWIMCKLTLKGWGVFKIKILLEAKFKGEPKFWGWLTCQSITPLPLLTLKFNLFEDFPSWSNFISISGESPSSLLASFHP